MEEIKHSIKNSRLFGQNEQRLFEQIITKTTLNVWGIFMGYNKQEISGQVYPHNFIRFEY